MINGSKYFKEKKKTPKLTNSIIDNSVRFLARLLPRDTSLLPHSLCRQCWEKDSQ